MNAKLKLAANKKTWLLVREDGKEMQVSPRVLSRGLSPLNAQEHDGLQVEYELEGGQPVKVRKAGAEWEPPRPPAPAQATGRPHSRSTRSSTHANTGRHFSPRPPGLFHNPYNFVPAPPRKTDDIELGDGPPEGHDHYHPDRWSGRIAVKLITHTPLLIPDGGQMEFLDNDQKKGHKIFPARRSGNQPYLAPTSIKGMLRSAFEAVTNSRFGVFEKHEDRLAYRMEARVGPIPARVENGGTKLRIMKAAVMGYAAKLPRYEKNGLPKDKGESKKNVALRYPNGDLPKHRDCVWVLVDGKDRVTTIQLRTDTKPPAAGNWKMGWVCVTGPNISGKIHERVFLSQTSDYCIDITEQHRSLWRELIQNYRDTHERDLKKRKDKGDEPEDYLGSEPGKTAWSRHIYSDHDRELHDGTLCYVELLGESQTDIKAIIPVTISRRLYAANPAELLPDSLKAAQVLNSLSPAERVFGWVNPNGSGAYRGNVRIGPVRCVSTPEPIETFKHHGVPLAILGQPKPHQTRFYVAATKSGEAQEDGISKEDAGYFPDKGLRGRKVYPHHSGLPETYWLNPEDDCTQENRQGFFQEYRRPQNPKGERDDQNRSIKGWVKPNIQFRFEIDVTNLSKVELGALLWLLTLPEGHFHRLGGGKPLGFGSVHLAVDWHGTNLHKGDWWQASYLKLDESMPLEETSNQIPIDPQNCISAFMKAVGAAYGKGDFHNVSFIAAFKRSVLGFADGKPIHYPRARQPEQPGNGPIPPHPEGKAFEWFVANERTGGDGGPKLSLLDLANDEGLPILNK